MEYKMYLVLVITLFKLSDQPFLVHKKQPTTKQNICANQGMPPGRCDGVPNELLPQKDEKKMLALALSHK